MSETKPQEAKPEKVKFSKRKIIAITAASVAGVLVFAGAGLGLYRNHQVQALTAECESMVSTVRKGQKSLTELVKSDDVVKVLKVSDKQVLDADKKVISDLKSTVEDAEAKINVPDCTIAFFDFDKNPAKDVRGVLKTVQGKATAVEEATVNVNKAVAAKTLSDAKAKLQKTVDSASKLLSDSDGKVQDNATRDNLSKALDSAKKILDDKKNTDVKKLDTKALDDAVAAVNASMEAKRQADEQAAAQAAAAAAAAAAQRAYTPQNNYNYSGGNYSNSVATAPSNSRESSSNQSSNFDPTNIDAWGGQGGEMPCQVVGTCQ